MRQENLGDFANLSKTFSGLHWHRQKWIRINSKILHGMLLGLTGLKFSTRGFEALLYIVTTAALPRSFVIAFWLIVALHYLHTEAALMPANILPMGGSLLFSRRIADQTLQPPNQHHRRSALCVTAGLSKRSFSQGCICL